MPGSMTWLISMKRGGVGGMCSFLAALAAAPNNNERLVNPMRRILECRRGNKRGNELRLFEPAEQLLKTRLGSQDAVVRIVYHPVALATAAREHPLQQVQRMAGFARPGMQAAGIDQR